MGKGKVKLTATTTFNDRAEIDLVERIIQTIRFKTT
jgi:hypothetical protein